MKHQSALPTDDLRQIQIPEYQSFLLRLSLTTFPMLVLLGVANNYGERVEFRRTIRLVPSVTMMILRHHQAVEIRLR